MRHIAVISLLLSNPGIAQAELSYDQALEAAAQETEAEYAARGPSSYAIDALNTDGFLTRWDNKDVQTIETPELVAIYDTRNKTCLWGFQTEEYPLLPRTAANAVNDHAMRHGWPETAVTPMQDTIDSCKRRTQLATLIGDLVSIDYFRLGPFQIFFGFAPSKVTS